MFGNIFQSKKNRMNKETQFLMKLQAGIIPPAQPVAPAQTFATAPPGIIAPTTDQTIAPSARVQLPI